MVGNGLGTRSLDGVTARQWRDVTREIPQTVDLLATGALASFALTPWKPSRSRYGQFSLIEEIGRGGAGVVYKAYDTDLDRDVALKLIPIGDEGIVSDLVHEAQIPAKLRHPNIAAIHVTFASEDVLGIAMPYYPNGSLADIRKTRPALLEDWGTLYGVIRGVVTGLHKAHAQNVLHLDIKPANVVLDEGDTPVLVDFGIARTRAGGDWGDSLHFGSLPYIAPELLEGASPSEASDIYSLGVTLFELVFGMRPLQGGMDLDELPGPCAGASDEQWRELHTLLVECSHSDWLQRIQSTDQLLARFEKIWQPNDEGASPQAQPQGSLKMVVAGVAGLSLAALGSVLAFGGDPGEYVSVSTASSIPAGTRILFQEVDPLGITPVGDAVTLGRAPFRSRRTPGASGWLIAETESGRAEWLLRPRDVGTRLVFEPKLESVSALVHNMVKLAMPAGGSLWVDRHEVTNADYAEFVAATGWPPPPSWQGDRPPQGWDALPVVTVSLTDAEAYARWAGKRLPTLSEWKAALEASSDFGENRPRANVNRGPDRNLIPHNDGKFDLGLLEYAEYTQPADPAGPQLTQMYGNVAEWTLSGTLLPGRGEDATRGAFIAGNAWHSHPGQKATADASLMAEETAKFVEVGFRCVLSDPPGIE